MSAPFPCVQAVTFDVGGTLLEPWPSVGHIYAEVAAKFGIGGIAPAALNRQFAQAWKARRRFDYSRAAWQELVQQTFAGLSPMPPGPDCFNAIYEHFARASAWRLFDDVLPALAAVRSRGMKLGVISNWDERLRPLLEEMKLSFHFNVLTVSCEVGDTKPAPEIFRHCAAQLGLAPASVLHVGDSASEDVAGAAAAGMHGVLLDRKAREQSDGMISSLNLVPDVLAQTPKQQRREGG